MPPEKCILQNQRNMATESEVAIVSKSINTHLLTTEIATAATIWSMRRFCLKQLVQMNMWNFIVNWNFIWWTQLFIVVGIFILIVGGCGGLWIAGSLTEIKVAFMYRSDAFSSIQNISAQGCGAYSACIFVEMLILIDSLAGLIWGVGLRWAGGGLIGWDKGWKHSLSG